MPVAPSNLIDNTRVKLGRLSSQIEAVAASEHPNSDSRLAVIDLRSRTDKLVRRLSGYEQYPDSIKAQLLKQANYLIFVITDLLGFLVRSTSTRNLFELYYPFLDLSKKLVDENVHLILSSDWRFSPFTYPFGLDELQNYILIGLPSSESENVLIFPTAAHELGHNIWRAHLFDDLLKTDIEAELLKCFEAARADFERIYQLKGADFQNDMFVQPIIKDSVHFLTRQMEEVFCDFTGMVIFGDSYIYAFDYLLAPAGAGKRDGEYPSAKDRVSFMEQYGAAIGISTAEVAKRFLDEPLSGVDSQDFPIKMADKALVALLPRLFGLASSYIHDRLGNRYSEAGRQTAIACFKAGVPSAENLSLGDLLNAAWDVYNASPEKGSLNSKGVELVPYLTDLVVKSAEILEYRSFLTRA